MIPTVILIAALLRRWWIVGVAAVLWPIVVIAWGDVDSVGGFLGAAALSVVNGVVGVALGRIIQALLRNVRGVAAGR